MKSVYLLQSDDGFYKVGVSKKPAKRVQQLQTGNAVNIKLIEVYETDDAFLLERSLKNRYAIYRVKGEWFDLPLEEELNFRTTCEMLDQNLKLLKNNGNIFL